MASKRARLTLAIGLWGVATAGGLYTIAAHGAAAGKPAEAPATLAASFRQTGLGQTGRATLVITAHPACPCTRATLHQLERVLTSTRETAAPADVVILFAGTQHDRVATDLRSLAERIKGARIIDDPNREIAKLLGAHTSGTVLFYDARGALKFSGGITPSRGHEGDSAGADAIRALLNDTSGVSRAPVYGCSLNSKSTP